MRTWTFNWSSYQSLQKLPCRFSEKTLFQNHQDARQFIDAGVVKKQKTNVIVGSGVPTARYCLERVTQENRENLRRELGLKQGEVTITMISRIIRSKGVLDFVVAAETITNHCSNVRFLLVGPEDSESLDRLDQQGLSRLKQYVTWPGPLQDIPAVLAESDVFVLPSAYREGVPRVLLEAASMALPIITTDTPGCNEVVVEGVNGYFTPVHDSQALSDAILRLIQQPELRKNFGLSSRKRAVENFDIKVIAAQLTSEYLELLSDGNSAVNHGQPTG